MESLDDMISDHEDASRSDDDSEDSYARQEREFALYSQIYHDASGMWMCL